MKLVKWQYLKLKIVCFEDYYRNKIRKAKKKVQCITQSNNIIKLRSIANKFKFSNYKINAIFEIINNLLFKKNDGQANI